MVRNYQQKTGRQQWSQQSMEQAVQCIISGQMSYRKASEQFEVPSSTLERYVRKRKENPMSTVDRTSGKFRCVFTVEQELELVQILKDMQNSLFGVTMKELRRLAFQLAEQIGCKHPFNKDIGMAGEDWGLGFMSRHPDLSLRKPEGKTSRNGNKDTVNQSTAASTSQMETDNQNTAASTSQSGPFLNETGIISDSQSEDSNHSAADLLAFEDVLIQEEPPEHKEADLLAFEDVLIQEEPPEHKVFIPETSSSVDSEMLRLRRASIDYAPETAEMPPPLTPSITFQSTSNSQSSLLPQQINRGTKRSLEMPPDLRNKQSRSDYVEADGIDTALNRLEELSDKADQLGTRDDDLDNFGRYVASLLRGFPTEKSTELQKEVINLILRSHVKLEASTIDLDASQAPPLSNSASSTLTPEALQMPRLTPERSEHSCSASSTIRSTIVHRKNYEENKPLQRLVSSQDTSLVPESPSVHSVSSVQQNNGENKIPPDRLTLSQRLSSARDTSTCHSLSSLQQNKPSQMSLLPDSEELTENDRSEHDDSLLETMRIDAALKRLESISDKVNQLSERDDNFDNFGKYVASLLRYVPTVRAIELQEEVIRLILGSRANSATQV